jgi:hypothetical protein
MSVLFHNTPCEDDPLLTTVVDDTAQNAALLRPPDGEKSLTSARPRKFGWYHPADEFPPHSERWKSGNHFVKVVGSDGDLLDVIRSLALFGIDDVPSITLDRSSSHKPLPICRLCALALAVR